MQPGLEPAEIARRREQLKKAAIARGAGRVVGHHGAPTPDRTGRIGMIIGG